MCLCTFSTSTHHRIVKKWSEPLVLWTCSLPNVLRVTTACTFWTSTSRSAPRLGCFAHFDLQMCFAPQGRATFSSFIWPAGSAPAALASLLFDPPEPLNIGKPQCFATFLPFRAPPSSVFGLSPSYFLPSDFLHVRVSSWLCFFLAELPSAICNNSLWWRLLFSDIWLICLTMAIMFDYLMGFDNDFMVIYNGFME